jgi:hypothetical protein
LPAAKGGVECAGKCEGTCTANAMAGNTGAQADGTCTMHIYNWREDAPANYTRRIALANGECSA